MSKSSCFNLTYSDDSIAILSIDVKDESQNVLKEVFIEEFNDLLDEIEQSDALGIILTSAKPDTFIAGADINMLKAMQDRESIARVADAGYATFGRLESFKLPVVAEINGTCLGGGLELSLACHGRVASDDKATKFALPEVQIGLLPGGGGTQRLPELIGVVEALGMMTTGKHIPAKKAYRMGLVDRLSNKTYLRQASRDLLAALRQNKIKRNQLASNDWRNPGKLVNHLLNKKLMKTKPVRDFILNKARDQVMAKTKGKYPAPLKIIDCVEAWARDGIPLGYETEARLFADLVLSPEAKQLMNLFFAITDLKKERFIEGRTKAKTIERLGIVGGGLMGSGIALVSAEKAGVPVRVQEMSRKALDKCMNYAYTRLLKKQKRRRLRPEQVKQIQQRITGTTDYSGFANCGLVIEAAYESLEIKHDVIKKIEANAPRGVIIATNTSSIPIADIAAVAKKPENVIGMHYFSPVEKMPLLEIIKTEQTSDKAITTAVEFGRKQGKTVIVVSDKAGFYANRILAPYMNEAARILSEGVPVEDIDRAMVEFGFPVGPFTLLDEVGIDVATKVMPILENAFGERMQAPECFAQLKASERQGKKSKKGFYDYSYKGDGARPVDASIYSDLGITPDKKLPMEEIQRRCHLVMLNEASLCLEDGVLATPRDGDIGAIFGLGYPPFLGGPFRYMDTVGLETIKEQMDELKAQGLEQFECSDLINTKSSEKTCYY